MENLITDHYKTSQIGFCETLLGEYKQQLSLVRPLGMIPKGGLSLKKNKKQQMKGLKMKDSLFKDKNVIITGHVNPDGDCIGSCLGLYYNIKHITKSCKVLLPVEGLKQYMGFPFVDDIMEAKYYDPLDAILWCAQTALIGLGLHIPTSSISPTK